MAYETRSSNSSCSEAKDWSFRSNSSSSILSNNNNMNIIMDQNEEKIPCFLVKHPYYHCITSLKTPNHHHITCLAVHNNLLYAASGNQITTFDLTTLSPTPSFDDGRDLSSGGGFIKSIAFYEDNKMLTAHQDSKIRVWKQHKFVTTLPTIKDKLGRCMCRSNYVKVRRNKSRLWITHNDAVSGLVEKHGVIYSVSWDKTLKIWRASDFKCLESVTAHEDAVNAVVVSDDGRVCTGSADGKIRVWERRESNDKVWRHSMVSSMEKHGSTVNALALSGDGKVLLSGGCDGVIMAWEIDRTVEKSGVVVGGHDGAVLCMIRLDGHDLFVSGGADRTVRVWGRVGGENGGGSRGLFGCMGVLEGHDKPVRSLAAVSSTSSESVSNGGVLVFSGSLDGEIKVWEIMVDELILNYHKVPCSASNLFRSSKTIKDIA